MFEKISAEAVEAGRPILKINRHTSLEYIADQVLTYIRRERHRSSSCYRWRYCFSLSRYKTRVQIVSLDQTTNVWYLYCHCPLLLAILKISINNLE